MLSLVCDDDDCGKSHEMRFWVSLDVIGKPRYKGFDFVCAEGKFDHAAKQFRLSMMKLIQATVSLTSKNKDKKSQSQSTQSGSNCGYYSRF